MTLSGDFMVTSVLMAAGAYHID